LRAVPGPTAPQEAKLDAKHCKTVMSEVVKNAAIS